MWELRSGVRTALLHHAMARFVSLKIARCDPPEPHIAQLLQHGADGLRRVAVPLLVRMHDVADLDFVFL